MDRIRESGTVTSCFPAVQSPAIISLPATYAQVCGRTLARAHGRSGDAATISGYLGRGNQFDDAVSLFAASYADQVTRDYEELVTAAQSGRLAAIPDA